MPFVNGRRVKTQLAPTDSVGSAATGFSVSSEEDGTVNALQYTIERPDGPQTSVSKRWTVHHLDDQTGTCDGCHSLITFDQLQIRVPQLDKNLVYEKEPTV